jgi:Holliday junction resolvasome RuvABC endonuclease subunit
LKKPVLVGIDPGFASVGLAVVELRASNDHVVAVKVLRTEKSSAKKNLLASDDNLRRAREISCELRKVLFSDDYQVVGICAESMSFPRNASAAAKVAMTWGILAALAQDTPIFQCSPQELKFRVVGSKTASKEDVQAALLQRFGADVAKLLDAPPSQHEHAYDALGAVVACGDADQIRMVRKMMV